jgi:iron-sulfur cluster assembly accessory protein
LLKGIYQPVPAGRGPSDNIGLTTVNLSDSDQADTVFELDGLKVFVDKTSLLYMDGVEFDYVELLNDAGFKFGNPNATGSCGCGSSFSV